ncbi:MAG: hypothetical protein AMK69_20760 [Nitrospira bacterium SG8_3]|nr:MAG: hypothetical protein AMK69_20760 [Nitrospira bacterium SG8_3]
MRNNYKTTLLFLALAFSSFIIAPSVGSAAKQAGPNIDPSSMNSAIHKAGSGIEPTFTSGPTVQKGKDKTKKKPKPVGTRSCSEVEKPCGTPGDGRFCACKEGGAEKTVICGCKGGGGTTTSPTNPPRTQGSAF